VKEFLLDPARIVQQLPKENTLLEKSRAKNMHGISERPILVIGKLEPGDSVLSYNLHYPSVNQKRYMNGKGMKYD